MFGLAIYDFTHGNIERLRQTFERKQRGICSYRTQWYIETSHAFVMSFADLAIEAFPDLKLVHVVRNPLQVCASQANRERFIRRWRIPFREYRGDNGCTYYRWRLTGDEPIYQHFAGEPLSLFQTFLIQWIELENRAQRFLNRYDKARDCFFLHSPGDLNDAAKVQEMFDFLGLPMKQPQVVLRGPQNRTPGSRKAEDDAQLRTELQQVLDRLPEEYLTIFDQPPYSALEWSPLLRPSSAIARHAAPAISPAR